MSLFKNNKIAKFVRLKGRRNPWNPPFPLIVFHPVYSNSYRIRRVFVRQQQYCDVRDILHIFGIHWNPPFPLVLTSIFQRQRPFRWFLWIPIRIQRVTTIRLQCSWDLIVFQNPWKPAISSYFVFNIPKAKVFRIFSLSSYWNSTCLWLTTTRLQSPLSVAHLTSKIYAEDVCFWLPSKGGQVLI